MESLFFCLFIFQKSAKIKAYSDCLIVCNDSLQLKLSLSNCGDSVLCK